MTIKTTVYTALSAVLTNTYAIELPERPTWPALVFEVDTTPEMNWVLGGGYDQHIVTVTTLAKTQTQIETYRPLVLAAMEALTGFMADEEHGDSGFEGDPDVYAYFQNFRIRTPKG